MHREELPEILNFEAWFKTLVRNQSYKFLNRLARQRLFLQEIAQKEKKSGNFTEDSAVSHEYEHFLEEALSQLPPQQRKVFVLSRQEGMKHEDIASQMGLSIYTIKNHMKAALHNIRVFLKEHCDSCF
jgi:RNA polymerase sigma factor (sigma-70 family)